VSKNAAQLLHVVKACDRQLAAFMTRMRKASNKNSTNSKLAAHSNAQQLGPDTLHALKDLSEALVAAGKLFSQYNHKGAVLDFVVRVVKAGGDENKFATLDKRIHGAMSVSATSVENC
jgi:P2-related tail formation protein